MWPERFNKVGVVTASAATANAGKAWRSPAARKANTAATGCSASAKASHASAIDAPGGTSARNGLSSKTASGMLSVNAMLTPSGHANCGTSRSGHPQGCARK